MIFKNVRSYDPSYAARILNDNFRRKEVFKTYLDVLRMIRRFTWSDENGIPWSQSLKLSAREEFESSRQEKDPEILARALFNARLALDELGEKYEQQRDVVNRQFEIQVNQSRMDKNRGIQIREHEIYERKAKPENFTVVQQQQQQQRQHQQFSSPLFNVDVNQFQVHPQMMNEHNCHNPNASGSRSPSPSSIPVMTEQGQFPELNYDETDIYAAAARLRNNNKKK